MRAPSDTDRLPHLRKAIIDAFMSADDDTFYKASAEAQSILRAKLGPLKPRGTAHPNHPQRKK